MCSRKIIYKSVVFIDFFYIHKPKVSQQVRVRTATLCQRAMIAETCVLMWTYSGDLWQQNSNYLRISLLGCVCSDKEALLLCRPLFCVFGRVRWPWEWSEWHFRLRWGSYAEFVISWRPAGMANPGIGASFDPNDMTRFVLNHSTVYISCLNLCNQIGFNKWVQCKLATNCKNN